MGSKKEKTARTYSVKISENAYQDIDDIAEYIAHINQQPLNSIRVVDAIFDTIQRIRLHPLAYKECAGLESKSKMYRKAICKSWLIIYRVQNSEITVLGVLYGSRHPKSIREMKRIK
jgi:plasmid stabilization system protein ParE